MKKLYIHIGVHKTGTTSIQHFLCHNRSILEQFGHTYPDIDITQAAHHKVANELIHDIGLSIFNKKSSLISDHNKFSRLKMLKKFITETPFNKIIISTEQLEWLTQPLIIKNYLGPLDYKIIIYLRRQDSYLESLYQTFVKGPIRQTRNFKTWSKHVLNTLKYHDFLTLLDRWANVFDQGNIRVLIFEEEIEKGLELGFLNSLDIDRKTYKDFSIPPISFLQKQRESLDARCIEFLRLCNKEKISLDQHMTLLSMMISISDILKRKGDFQKYIISRQNRMEIMNSVEQANSEILKKYFPGKAELFPAISEPDVSPNIGVKEVIPLFIKLWTHGLNRKKTPNSDKIQP